jgi:hypothetical protein
MFFGASLANDHHSTPAPPAPAPQPIRVEAASTSTYAPQSRDVLITTVPLLVHEQISTFDWLKQDFRKGGVFDGTEVWGFYPSTVTVYAGDTVNLTVVNPSDDPHTFTVPDLGYNLAVGTQTQVTGRACSRSNAR